MPINDYKLKLRILLGITKSHLLIIIDRYSLLDIMADTNTGNAHSNVYLDNKWKSDICGCFSDPTTCKIIIILIIL